MKRRFAVLFVILTLLCAISVPVYATVNNPGFGENGYVVDAPLLLTEEQEMRLEEMICDISAVNPCGIYIVIDDYTKYEETIIDSVIGLYHVMELGYGEGRDGIFLMMDPVHREFAFFVYGEYAEYVFDDYGQAELETVFLDDFGEDAWYAGFEDFVVECGAYMELAAQGEPVRQDKTLHYVVMGLVSLLCGGAFCGIKLNGMKNVSEETEAASYVSAKGLTLTSKKDNFLYKTQTVVDISTDDDDSSSGSSTGSFRGGGGSGRSGSF